MRAMQSAAESVLNLSGRHLRSPAPAYAMLGLDGRRHKIDRWLPFGPRKTLDRFGQILDSRRGNKAHIRGLAAEKSGRIDQKSAASAILKIGVEHRLAGGRDRLDHLVPAVHLIDQVPVDLFGLVLFENALACSGPVAREVTNSKPGHRFVNSSWIFCMTGRKSKPLFGQSGPVVGRREGNRLSGFASCCRFLPHAAPGNVRN